MATLKLSVKVLIKNPESTKKEVYIFIFTDRAKFLRSMGRYASNPDLSFTFEDAVNLSKPSGRP